MSSVRGWENWLNEYQSLVEKATGGEDSIPPHDSNRLCYLRNLLEAGLGTKTTLSEDNQRLELRIPLDIPVTIRVNDKEWQGRTVNVSIWGMFVSLAGAPASGSKGQVVIIASGSELCLSCEILWVRSQPQGPLPPGAGLRITSPERNQHNTYREFCQKTLREAILKKVS